MKVVASFTTMPNRIDLIRPVLDSIRAQRPKGVSHIEINVPYTCVRTGEEYVIPEWLHTYPSLQIYRTEDYGPITKIAPTLLRYKNTTDTYLWSVDDDIQYPPNTLDVLLRRHDHTKKRVLANVVSSLTEKEGFLPNAAVPGEGMLLEGFGTVLYPPSCIGDDFKEYVETTSTIPDCRLSDDVLLSNYIHGRSIPIYRCPLYPAEAASPFHTRVLLPHTYDISATTFQSGGHYIRYIRVIHHLAALGLLTWTSKFPSLPSST
jgi:hypothetical protein